MKKKFDCVQIKNDIQQKLLKEYKGLSLEKRKELMNNKISNDPILGSWMKAAKRKHFDQVQMVAEESAEYSV